MQEQDIHQIQNVILNLESAKKTIPYLSDLENHPVFGTIFGGLSGEEKKEVQHIIDSYILDKLEMIKKTKGGQLFNRFFEGSPDMFWEFRRMNDSAIDDVNFQTLGKQVETEMFKLEGILTEKMLKQEKGLEKVVDSFYNIVYLFFPRFNEII